jgi:signal transduction histidine kinase
LLIGLSEIDGLEQALGQILNSAIELVHADAGYIRLFDPPDDHFPLVAQVGFSPEFIEYVSAFPTPINPEGRAALQSGQRNVIEDMFAYLPFKPHLPLVADGYTSMQGTPMMRGTTAVGAICTYFLERHTPSDEEFAVLDTYASLAASVIEKEAQAAEQRQLEQALREAMAAKDEFLGLVSHELRTPMTIVRGLSSVLNRHIEMPLDDLRQTYRDLAVESDRLSTLIDNMLMLARAEAGQARHSEPISVNRLLEACVAKIRKELPALEVAFEPSPENQTVFGVENYVVQILHNLVENAFKYSPAGEAVQLSVAEAGDNVVISVADRGIGLDDPSSLFQPFRRETRAQSMAPGIGLGLAVCKRLVEAQGGTIWAESRPAGGSIFSFTLPKSTY